MPPTVATPMVLTNPGFLWAAPIGTVEPTHAAAGGVFTDSVPAAWIPLGATTDGSTFNYSTTVEPIRAAELFDPVQFETTERGGSIAFNLMDYTLSNYRRALNGGVAALTPTGTAGSEITRLSPPNPGEEVRSMILWESTDSTLRLILFQTLQGGEISSAFQKAPSVAAIPCTFNMEIPAGTSEPWAMIAAGTARVGA